MRELGLALVDDSAPGWPDGIVSHVAGSRADGGLTVVDVWESQAAFDRFMADRLQPAFEAVGGVPQPAVVPFEVRNAYRHGRG
jgi:hypothetical protein